MHPGYFGVDGASKEGVSKCKVVVGAEFKKSLTIFVHFTQVMRPERDSTDRIPLQPER